MPKISALPPITSIATTDEVPVNDTSATTTKKMTVEQLLGVIYPVGSLYFNATNSANPGTLLGFGTWAAFGAGRVPVGYDSSQTEFNAAEKTGGAKTHTLTTAEMPAHTHGQYVTANSGAAVRKDYAADQSTGPYDQGQQTMSSGGGGAHNNLQPYITVYIWKRTA